MSDHRNTDANEQPPVDDDHAYRRAARLLAQKLGVDWRTLPRQQVEEYMRKIEQGRRVMGKRP